MPLPAPLSRRNPHISKNDCGHVLVVAGSASMLGAAALVGLAAMRCGAGLVTIAVPKDLNLTLQKKISPVIMTLPLAVGAFAQLKKCWDKFDALAIGPGMGQDKGAQKFIRELIAACPKPIVIDADALNALAHDLRALKKNPAAKVLTPHPGEMARLTGTPVKAVQAERRAIAVSFSKQNNCVLLLKGHRTVVASPDGKVYVNKTGNAGMATAGSGDVLTGMIAALLGQGVNAFEAAKAAAYLHGRAGDLAAKAKTKAGMIANDIIEFIPNAIREGQ